MWICGRRGCWTFSLSVSPDFQLIVSVRLSSRRSSYPLEYLKGSREQRRCISFTAGASTPTRTSPPHTHPIDGYDAPEAPTSVCLLPSQRGRAAVPVPAGAVWLDPAESSFLRRFISRRQAQQAAPELRPRLNLWSGKKGRRITLTRPD